MKQRQRGKKTKKQNTNSNLQLAHDSNKKHPHTGNTPCYHISKSALFKVRAYM